MWNFLKNIEHFIDLFLYSSNEDSVFVSIPWINI